MASNTEEESVREKGGDEARVTVYSKEERGVEEEGALLVQKALNEAIIASGMGDLALDDEPEIEVRKRKTLILIYCNLFRIVSTQSIRKRRTRDGQQNG